MKNVNISKQAKGLSIFEKYLTVWVALYIIGGIVLGRFAPGAALATVVGVLIEVPVMLMLVRICLRTRNWFQTAPIKIDTSVKEIP